MTRRSRVRSAHVRLAITYVAVFSVSVLALGVVSYLTIQRSLEAQMRQRVEAELAQLMGDYRDDGLEELRHDIEERIDSAPTNRLRYFIRNSEDRVVFDELAAVPTEPGWHRLTAPDGTDILLYSQPLDDGYTFALAADLTAIRDTRAAMQHSFGIALLVTLLLGVLGSVVVSRRFMARLESFNRTTERVGSGALSERIAINGTGDDFDQLALVINRMLERIEQLVGNVRRVSTNIAHDMRTPLGRIRQRLEAIRDSPIRTDVDIEGVIAQLDDSLATFAALLRIADIESGTRRSGFVDVDLSALMTNIAAAYEPVAEDLGISLHCEAAPDVRIRGDSSLLTQAFANLVENALRHANPTQIHVSLSPTPNGWRAAVTDNGTGIPANERDLVTEPFYRLEKSRTTEGNGLGLSLVDAVAGLHGARLEFIDQEPGLAVVLTFVADSTQ